MMTREEARQARHDYEDGKLTFEELKAKFTGFKFASVPQDRSGMSMEDLWPGSGTANDILGALFPNDLRSEIVQHAYATAKVGLVGSLPSPVADSLANHSNLPEPKQSVPQAEEPEPESPQRAPEVRTPTVRSTHHAQQRPSACSSLNPDVRQEYEKYLPNQVLTDGDIEMLKAFGF